MEYKPQQIYCDESGTTGSKLLDPDQPFFGYASVAIDDGVARACVAKVRKDYRVQASELKAKNLLPYNKGRRAISYIMEHYHEHILVSIYHKKYCLACKLFEYVFEPTVAQASSTFYGIGFHKFIANLLYAYFATSARYAENIFSDFEKMMRELDEASATHLFSRLDFPAMNPVLDLIKTFCYHNRDAIRKELAALGRGDGVGKWVLDLTDTALFTHLGTWGSKFTSLDVYCDRSAALGEMVQLLTPVMIGRREKIYDSFLNKEQPITFNLARNIEMADSIDHPGIQLADVAAGAIVYIFQNPSDKQAQEWSQYLPGMLHPLSVLPEVEQIDLSTLGAQRGILLLRELVRRSQRHQSLTAGIGEFIYETTRRLAVTSGLVP